MADESTAAATTDTPASEEALKFDVKIEDAGPACKALTITIPQDQIKKKIEAGYGTLEDDAVVPGFRKGRAPRRLLEKRFSTAVRDDVKNALLSESYTKAMEDHKLDPLSDPQVQGADKIELPESGDLTFTVKVEVTPEVELPAFDTIEVTKTTKQVTDADVKHEIERFSQQAGRPTTLQDAAIEVGDYAGVEVSIFAGENAGEGAEVLQQIPQDHVLVNGEAQEFKGHVAGIVVEDLGKKLTGKKAGDVVTVSMTGPSGHENEQIKDKPITIKLTVQSVHRIEPASVDTLIKQMGLGSEEELHERVRSMLEMRNEQNQKADMYQQVTDQLVDKVKLDLPAGITSQQSARVLQRSAMDLLYRGVPEEVVREKVAELRGASEGQAVRQLKHFFILDKASKELGIDVEEQELNGRIAMLAMQQNRRPDKLRQEMGRQGQIEQLYLQIREQKTLDKILEQAKVTEVEGKADAEGEAVKKKPSKKKSSKKKADDAGDSEDSE